jgi:hypothetical protein
VVVSSHLNSSNNSLVPWTSKIPDNGVSYSPLAALTIPQKTCSSWNPIFFHLRISRDVLGPCHTCFGHVMGAKWGM